MAGCTWTHVCSWGMTMLKARKSEVMAVLEKHDIGVLLVNGLRAGQSGKVNQLSRYLSDRFVSVTTEAVDANSRKRPLKRADDKIVLLALESWSDDMVDRVAVLRRHQLGAKVLCLFTDRVNVKVSTLQQVKVNGAVGLDSNFVPVTNAILAVVEGLPYYSRRLWYPLAGVHELERPYKGVFKDSLTNKEQEVLRHIALEFTNEQIADKLRMAKRTADSHRECLLQKLNAKNTAGLVKAAIAFELIELGD